MGRSAWAAGGQTRRHAAGRRHAWPRPHRLTAVGRDPARRPARLPPPRRTSVFTACGLGGTAPDDTWTPPTNTGPVEWEPDEEGEGPVLGNPQGAPPGWSGSEGWGAILGGWNATGALNVTGPWNQSGTDSSD